MINFTNCLTMGAKYLEVVKRGQMTTPPSFPLPHPTDAALHSPYTLKRTRPIRAERPLVHVDLAMGKADGPHRKKLRTYLGIVARDKPTRTVSMTFMTLVRKSEPNFVRAAKTFRGRMCEKRHRPFRNKTLPLTCCLVGKLMDEMKKKQLEEAAQSGSTDPWKMARTKKNGQMTSEAAKEIADKIDSLEEQAPQDIRMTSPSSSSMAPEDLEQLAQKIRDQLEESIIEKSQFQSQMQSQGLAIPPKPEVGSSVACVSTKERNDPDTGDSEKCRLYIEENPLRLIALGRLYEGSTTVHSIPLRHDQVKVGVEEVRDADALIPIPTTEGAVRPVKPIDRPDHDVMWDATMFGVFNDKFPLYIKHEDLSEIAHGVHMGKWSSFYLRKMLSSDFVRCIIGQTTTSRELLTVGNINILIVQYTSMFVLNSTLKGLDDTPQSKSKATTWWIVVKVHLGLLKKQITY
ncbi:hypothetical protein HKD37_20G055775 [Glycine soja]